MLPTSQQVTPKVSYAQMIQNMQVPTKEQAIILDAVEGITVSEYTLAIGKIMEPTILNSSHVLATEEFACI